MSETFFFAAHSDVLALCQWLCEEFKCTFAYDGSEEVEPPKLHGITEIEDIIRKDDFGPRFFITSPQWSSLPLDFNRVKTKEDKLRTFIKQRIGGPSFDLKLPNILFDRKRIVAGWIMDYNFYYVRAGSPETIERPDAMTSAMKSVRKYLRDHGSLSVRLDSQRTPSRYALREAIQMFQKGWHLTQGDWEFVPRKAEQVAGGDGTR